MHDLGMSHNKIYLTVHNVILNSKTAQPPKSKKGCKDQESIQSSTTPDPGHQRESNKPRVRHHNESLEVSPFPAGDHKAHINRRARTQAQQTEDRKNTKDPQKSTAPERSVKYFTGGLKPVKRCTNPTPDGKAHFTNLSYGFFHGPKQCLWVYTPEDKLRDDDFPNGGEKINTLP